MPAGPIRIAIRLVLALAVAIALMLPRAPVSASHDPASLTAAATQRHAELGAVAVGPGHVHENGTLYERVPGHSHGHNPTDHSHETPSMAKGGLPSTPPYARTRFAVLETGANLSARYRFLRPPRTLSSPSEEA